MRRSPLLRPATLCALGLASLISLQSAKAFDHTYIAVGDSLTFGTGRDQTAADISNGDRGWVYAFGNLLTDPSTGVRPNVINIGVPGETTESFKGTGPNHASDMARLLNTHYQIPSPPDQHDMLVSVITSELSKGNTIDNVSIQLGANDLFVMAESTAFQTADAATQASMVNALFGSLQNNLAGIIGLVKTMSPSTRVVLMGYYDPFAPYYNSPSDPRFPYARFSHDTIPGVNQLMAGLAGAFPNTVAVNPYGLFVGNELSLTYVGDPDANVHPNPLGYSAIASTLAPVPEPSSFVLLALGGAAVALRVRRARRAG